jgi:uncharacterized protein
VLGIDPGIRTGTKCAALDDTGKYLGNFVIYNHKVEEGKRLILEGIKAWNVQLVAIGNGTGTREVQELVASVIEQNRLDILYTVVDEDGASVYSASDIAREEFPELDLTIRGAISIGRRLQDPLAELVKIDPKSIGVGLYQHDVNQKKLSDTLTRAWISVGEQRRRQPQHRQRLPPFKVRVPASTAQMAKKIGQAPGREGADRQPRRAHGGIGMGPKS